MSADSRSGAVPTTDDPIALALWHEMARQCQWSDENPPPPGFPCFPSGWHTVPEGRGTGVNLIELAAAVRRVL